MSELKTCTKCGTQKLLTKFRYVKSRPISVCKGCESLYTKQKVKKELDADPTWRMFKAAKGRAKKNGLEFNLTKAYLQELYTDRCPVLRVPLRLAQDCQTDNSPSLDRIDPTKGYVQGNVQIISWRANKLKNNASLDELKALVRYMEQQA